MLELPLAPQLLNQAPPGAQQLSLPDFFKVPHLVHVLEVTVVAAAFVEVLEATVVAAVLVEALVEGCSVGV